MTADRKTKTRKEQTRMQKKNRTGTQKQNRTGTQKQNRTGTQKQNRTGTQKQTGKGILRLVFLAVAGMLIGYSMYLFNARVILHEPLPMPFGYGQAVVTSGSMSPAFEVDALLIYHAQEGYQVGDMVAFMDDNGNLVTHRIIEMEDDRIVTQGDANSMADDPIEEAQIYGKVIHIIPHAGKIVRMLQKPGLILVLIVLLLAGLEWNYRQNKKAAQSRLEEQRREVEELRRELYK